MKKQNVTGSTAPWQLIALLITFTVAVAVGVVILYPNKSLPILQPSDLNPALVVAQDWSREQHTIASFNLINQFGDTVRLQDVLEEEKGWRILSHSVTPEADSVPVLRDYALRMNAEHSNWWFLTGSKEEIFRLARRSYFACYDEASGGDGGMQDFVHTENVVLVDQLGRLRGFYDGTSESSMNQLIEDCLWLIGQKK